MRVTYGCRSFAIKKHFADVRYMHKWDEPITLELDPSCFILDGILD